MSAEFGPYVQMGKLAQQMANQYQKDTNLALEPLLSHFIEEVEVNVAADRFDHAGFMSKIRGSVALAADEAVHPRCKAFLQAVEGALHECMERHGGSSSGAVERAKDADSLLPSA
jgi:hypothetical protein